MDIDEALAETAKGNAEALRIVYEQLRPVVYSLAFSILKEKQAAEDVLHDTFVRVYERAATFRPGTHPKAWVVRIARHLAYDAYRRRKRTVPDDEDRAADTAAEHTLVQKLDLADALLRLGEIERQIVILHVMAGLKHREIGEELGLPAGTVRWKYRQSLSKLARWIGGESDEPGTAGFSAQTGIDAKRT